MFQATTRTCSSVPWCTRPSFATPPLQSDGRGRYFRVIGVWLILGIAVGAGAMALAAWWRVRRSSARARVAERRARAAERLAELGAMTGGLAHEIKNPLSTIGLNAQLLAEGIDELPADAPADPELKQRLSRRLASLRRETERLRGILTDFLNYAGEVRVDLRATDINEVVSELADFFGPQAQQQGVRMRLDASGGTLRAQVDGALLKQALLNLLLNSVQAMASMPAGTGPRELILKSSRGHDSEKVPVVEIRVIDTGPGMAPEVLAKLFTPYFTTKAGGSGLGLPTTRRLIEAQNGRIDVHSEPGRGTVFTIAFPALA
ncbi:MAG: sensor histidine kinase [Leptolyngbya sp. PLA1]|nr:sensor histidine kinase [Leptolyngbya sp. PLA1]